MLVPRKKDENTKKGKYVLLNIGRKQQRKVATPNQLVLWQYDSLCV